MYILMPLFQNSVAPVQIMNGRNYLYGSRRVLLQNKLNIPASPGPQRMRKAGHPTDRPYIAFQIPPTSH